MAKLGIDKDFLVDFARLEPPVRKRIVEVFGKFEQTTHAGLHLEKVKNARDPRLRTIRIDQYWRGVVLAPERGDSHLLLKVLPHDDAYDWAQRRLVSVNSATGGIEIRDVAAIDATLPELSKMAERRSERLLDKVSDADLRRLGVDDQTLAFARALTDLVQLEAARAFLPQHQYDVLIGLALGYTPEQVWEELGGGAEEPQTYDPDDIDAAVARTPERVVLVEGPDELMEVFQRPFALWRVYLHPTQRKVAYGSFSGPARVTGGPGTGKTVVALHRARHLASRLGEADKPVLLTTYTTTLAESLRDGLRLLVTDDDVLGRIDVRHVDTLAYRIVAQRHGRPTILRDPEQKQIWRRIIRDLELPFSDSFLAQEWRQVVLAQDITTADGYLRAKRAGRGRRLGPQQKALVWQAVTAFTDELAARNVWTYETVCVEATRLLQESGDRPYRHIIVDEAQDLHPVRWRLLRAAVPEGPDDIFIAGDTHQRIYDNRVTLKGVGINVAGRSARLTVNYRTTAEILAWSLGMLAGERIDDMDEGLESLAGCRSDVHGQRPELRGAATKPLELKALVAKVRGWLDAGIEPGDIGIAARNNMLVNSAVRALRDAGVPACNLDEGKAGDGEVQLATMHRMKGLEFRCVAVIGVGEHQVPSGAVTRIDEDEVTHYHDLQREKCLLFVACTRAREELYVSWHGIASPFLTALR
ncbi:DNA helicase [Actinomadura sp. NBRC 104425]|uniref:UvrD-helicase domain-containing protein n=1 Tax=Actinomadura sp. NBRC 104425 TaxID=3032204 RepID=UPI0024A10295|nr:UvrD-helicase domain-containing protein [Actinomadura sp. NBRC 104425]GLZ14525.1 DNA helicase [Actinomadura sp. NBRC 104425]